MGIVTTESTGMYGGRRRGWEREERSVVHPHLSLPHTLALPHTLRRHATMMYDRTAAAAIPDWENIGQCVEAEYMQLKPEPLLVL